MTPEQTDAQGSADARVTRYPVRRAPRIPAFLVTGAVLGAVVGVLIDVLGPDGRCPEGGAGCAASYSPGTSLAYFLVLGVLAGLAVGGAAAVLAERLLDRGGSR